MTVPGNQLTARYTYDVSVAVNNVTALTMENYTSSSLITPVDGTVIL